MAHIARNNVKKAYLNDRDKQCKECGYGLLRYIYGHYRFFSERGGVGNENGATKNLELLASRYDDMRTDRPSDILAWSDTAFRKKRNISCHSLSCGRKNGITDRQLTFLPILPTAERCTYYLSSRRYLTVTIYI
ncbi:hypothetical protein D4T62_13790 [Salmonella enterica subsp. enterica]|nr:hypothetical protein [Salmonella enterica subsp. enterica]